MKRNIFLLTGLVASLCFGTASARSGFDTSGSGYRRGFDSYGNNQSIRYYNQYGGYQGEARPNINGGYSTYNQYGGYTGKIEPRIGGGYSYYDQYGGFQGYSR